MIVHTLRLSFCKIQSVCVHVVKTKMRKKSVDRWERKRVRDREGERDGKIERNRETERNRDRDRDRQRNKNMDRKKQTDRQRQREIEKEKERDPSYSPYQCQPSHVG